MNICQFCGWEVRQIDWYNFYNQKPICDDCNMDMSIERERECVMSWTVWVGGGEVNSYLLNKEQAKDIAQEWKDKGYDDVVVEEVS